MRANFKPNMAGEYATKCLHLVNAVNIQSLMFGTNLNLVRFLMSIANDNEYINDVIVSAVRGKEGLSR